MTPITLYRCKIGSHAYGLATPESDLDLRGVAIPDDLAYYFGLKTFEQQIYSEDEDHVAWHLSKFCRLAAAGNTQMLEMLFNPEDCVLITHPAFKKHVLDFRHKFITKRIYNAIHGYAYSEHRKALGESSRDLGLRRKEDLKAHGYSSRNASHCIRLMYAGTIALTEGYFPVRLPDVERKVCMMLKLGQATLDEYQYLYTSYLQDLEAAYTNSDLPDDFDSEWLDQTLIALQLEVLREQNLL